MNLSLVNFFMDLLSSSEVSWMETRGRDSYPNGAQIMKFTFGKYFPVFLSYWQAKTDFLMDWSFNGETILQICRLMCTFDLQLLSQTWGVPLSNVWMLLSAYYSNLWIYLANIFFWMVANSPTTLTAFFFPLEGPNVKCAWTFWIRLCLEKVLFSTSCTHESNHRKSWFLEVCRSFQLREQIQKQQSEPWLG